MLLQIVKIQAWEENFRTKLTNLRNNEMLKLRRYFVASAISVSMYSSTPLLVSLATFAAYTLIGKHHLDVAQALTALALFDILRFPLFMLPQIINRIVEASISFERVRKFLLAEEYQRVGEGALEQNGEIYINNGTFVYDSKKPTLLDDEGGKKKGGIRGLMHQQTRLMQEAALNQQWEMALLRAQLIDAEKTIAKLNDKGTISSHSMLMDENEEGGEFSPSSLLSLRRVTMQVKRGEFVAVVGGVGAGKSTLINSILGEGRPLTGTELAVKGTLGTFVQSPFILNDTVRNNILFGHAPLPKGSKGGGAEAIDEERYKLAVEVSSLSHDFALLPHGDQTEIGEKGITLSGGQKARVALARTVYHDADVYLLDDPLAAVDAHVGKDLFNKCIVDEMLLGKSKGNKSGERNATVILVTNALQYLSHPMVDKIICLGDGRVKEVGTFSQLSSDPNSRFSAFLKVLSETSVGAMDTSGADVEYVSDDVEYVPDDEMSGNLDLGGEPEVAKIITSPPCSPSHRKISIQSVDGSVDGGNSDEQKGALMTDEFKEREKGAVDRRVYFAWSKAAGGISVGVTILSMFVGVECLQVLSKWWLTHWSESGGVNVVFYLGIYAVINFR
jgi:ABC-type multidrug transport system fused ATPase/permease subunit